MGKLVKVLLLTAVALGLSAFAPDRAEAISIRFSCDVYAINNQDPIGDADHDHVQIGNTSLSNSSTGRTLFDHKDTSCEESVTTNTSPITSAAWFPVERDTTVPNAIIYYRAPGDQTAIINFKRGQQLIGHTHAGNSFDEVTYQCGSSPGNPSPSTTTPPYGCTENWTTSVMMPRCYDNSGILTEEHTIYGPNRVSCPTGYSLLPETNILIRHTDPPPPNPLEVSVGTSQWGSYTSMHGDYFFAAQDEWHTAQDFNGNSQIDHTDGGYSEKPLFNLCLKQAPDELEFNNERCRAGGLLPHHVTAIDNYYNP